MTIWRMHTLWCVYKATKTHTHRICNIYCFSTAKMFTRTRLNFHHALPVLLPFKSRSIRNLLAFHLMLCLLDLSGSE